jgi:hypothetical protein
VRKVVIASAVVTTLTSAGPPFDPQVDITVAAGDVYVSRLFNIVKVAISGGPVSDVTSRGEEFDHVAYAPSLASTTYASEVQGIVATPDGHRLFFSNRTGVGVIED